MGALALERWALEGSSRTPAGSDTVGHPVTFALGRRLLHAGVVQPHELRRAIFVAASSDVPFARALADASTGAARVLAEPLDDGTKPRQRTIQAVRELVEKLPEGLCARLMVLPVRVDPRTGTVDVALVDPADHHAVTELAYHLQAPIRPVVTSLDEMERAIASLVAATRGPRLRPSLLPPPAPASVAPPARASVRPPAYVEAPLGADDEAPLPLVRRSRNSLPPPPAGVSDGDRRDAYPQREREPVTTPWSQPPPGAAPRPAGGGSDGARESRRDTADFEKPKLPPGHAAAQPMVLDFSNAAREARDAPSTHRGAPPAPSRTAIAPKLPPYGSLTRVLEYIDEVETRDELLAALLEGLRTFARGAAILAARRGRFVGVAAEGLELERFRTANVGQEGAVAEAIELGERVGVLRSAADAPLLAALELAGAPAIEVVLRPAFVAGRPALVLAAFGVGDLQEGARRARVLATAAGATLERLVKNARGG